MTSVHMRNLGPRNLLNFCTCHGTVWHFPKLYINLFRSVEGTGMVSVMIYEILNPLGLDLKID